MQCPTCKGTGRQTLTVRNLCDDDDTVEVIEITCLVCRGDRTITSHQYAEIQWSKDQWCKCGEPDGARYVPDNVSDICDKHHWLCNACDKITQVG